MTNKVQGTGLGMAITKSIVDLMGGTITVESAVDRGSRFEVCLTFPIDRSVEPKMGKEHLLLLSDDAVLTQNVAAAVRESGVRFSAAATLEEALALLAQSKADLLLLSGYLHDQALADTVQKLRAAAQDAALIFCCDYAQPEQVHDLLARCGVDGLVPRPFFLSNLLHAMARLDSTAEAVEQSHAALAGMRFLCAEDNALNAEILEAILDLNGAACVIYPNGKELVEAFAQVRPGQYDAILMDVQMPVMNGLEATRAIRRSENPLGQTIPIIAMTANAFTEDIQKCLASGMDAHVAKPLDIAVLERAIRGGSVPHPYKT